MIEISQVQNVSTEVARQLIGDAALERTIVERTTDSDGNDALRVVVVLKHDGARDVTGDKALDLLVRLQHDLQKAGEERLPIIEYATEQDLAAEDVSGDDLDEDDA